jgi:hypothetical protein
VQDGADKRVWVWCWLRIAQWMRASLKLFVVKFLRAYGGCLGIRSR